jgi:hypothetical protein
VRASSEIIIQEFPAEARHTHSRRTARRTR